MDVVEPYRRGLLDGIELALEILDGYGGRPGLEAAAVGLRSAKARRVMERNRIAADGSLVAPVVLDADGEPCGALVLEG